MEDNGDGQPVCNSCSRVAIDRWCSTCKNAWSQTGPTFRSLQICLAADDETMFAKSLKLKRKVINWLLLPKKQPAIMPSCCSRRPHLPP